HDNRNCPRDLPGFPGRHRRRQVGKRPGLQRCQEDVRRPGRRATAQPSVKCSPESFAELVEREGIVPAPYLARALWAQERELGHSLDRRELERLLREAYDIV